MTGENATKQIRASDRFCLACERVKQCQYFGESPVSYHNKYLPVCKKCCVSLYNSYLSETGDDRAALWLLLARMNLPYINKLYEKANKAVEDDMRKQTVLFNAYIKEMKKSKIVFTGFLQSTNMLSEFLGGEVKQTVKDDTIIEQLQEEPIIWGNFYKDEKRKIYDEEAYTFLNKTFEQYTQDLPEMDTNMINRYRDLCKCEWRLRKANESGDGNEITKAQDALNKQLKLLSLDNFEVDKKSEQEKFIDRIAWLIEETEPAEEEDLEKYRDIAGFEKSFSNLMRSMKNLLCGTRDFPDIPEEEK